VTGARRSTLIGAGAVAVLAAGSTAAVAAATGAFTRSPVRSSVSCAAPVLAGTVIDVSLVDMGRMMGATSGGSMMGGGFLGPMRMLTAPASAPAGVVSFRVHNSGSRTHELVVLPLGLGRAAGQRTIGGDARVSETASLGEASRTCGVGAGAGITAGATGWVTLTVGRGAYELVCNLPHHYRDGMYATLIVT